MNRKILLPLFGFALLVLVLGALVYRLAPGAGQAATAPPAPVLDPTALVRFHSPSFGDAGAKVHIVEFFDPACGTCRSFYPFVKDLMQAHPGRIRLSVRYVPFHKGSDEVVRMLEAARRQGKYREALEALLAAQPQWTVNHVAQPELALRALEGLGLQLERLRADMRSPEIGRLIEQDFQDAATLRVEKTPEFFVNGRPMPRFGYEELRTLVEQALREAYG